MNALLLIIALLLSPKGGEFQSSLGKPMAPRVAVKRPLVTRIPFAWDSSNTPDTFELGYGSLPGVYTNTIATGLTNGYTFVQTNWAERSVEHYFAVRAMVGGSVSAWSAEMHYPSYPADHYRLTWAQVGTVALYTASGLPIHWQPLATVTGTNEFTGPLASPAQFFGSPDARLAVTLFNPLN